MSRLLNKQSSNQNLTSKLSNASPFDSSTQVKNYNDDQKNIQNADILKNVKEKEYAGTDHCQKQGIDEASHQELNKSKNKELKSLNNEKLSLDN